MRLSPSFVAIKRITCNQPRSLFNSDQIEAAAKAIIAAEGTINPIIVERTGINSFELIDGDFQFYATVRAKEIDPEKGETVSAYIIDEENRNIFQQQLEIFRKQLTQTTSSETQSNSNNSIQYSLITNLETRLTNMESSFETRLTEIKQEYIQKFQEQQQQIEELKTQLPEKVEPLTTFNQASVQDLTLKLKPITKKKTENLVKQIEQLRPFNSLQEVQQKVKGLGTQTMFTILDSWLYNI